MRNWHTIDWDQDRPSLDELIASWQDLEWESRPIESAALDAYLDQVRWTHSNGGVLVGRWRATAYSDVTSWFVARNRLEEYELHRALLDSQVVRSTLPELDIPTRLERVPGALAEDPAGALTLDGQLARLITRGGAYQRFAGTGAEAKQLAHAAVVDLTGERYDDFRVDHTHSPWTPWFFDIAWDDTYVLTDRRHAEVTILCVTDTD